MSELEIKTFGVGYAFNWEYSPSIDKIRKDLDEIEKLGGTHVDVDTYDEYGETYISFAALSKRTETQDEFDERTAKNQEAKAAFKDRELAQLKKLKAKYE
jgi:hypothetical protein